MNSRGRFDGLGRSPAIAVLAGFLALVVWGLVAGTAFSPAEQDSDPVKVHAALYKDIADRMVGGQDYYSAIDESQTAHHYPTRPFPTVREPTLAYITKIVGGTERANAAFWGLGIVAFALLLVGLERVSPSRLSWWSASLVGIIAVAPFMTGTSATFHEFWAGFLVVVAVMLHGLGRWKLSFVVAMAAVFVRELALPLLAVMALCEFLAGRRKRAAMWIAGIAVFVVFLAFHALVVDRLVAPTADVSPGWLKFGGWEFFVDSVRYSTIMAVMPAWVAAVAVPAAILGWASRTGDLATRVFILIVAYALSFAVVGRPENYYWGLLFVTLLVPGIAYAPSAITTLIRRVALSDR